jgi:hypothetical protein
MKYLNSERRGKQRPRSLSEQIIIPVFTECKLTNCHKEFELSEEVNLNRCLTEEYDSKRKLQKTD